MFAELSSATSLFVDIGSLLREGEFPLIDFFFQLRGYDCFRSSALTVYICNWFSQANIRVFDSSDVDKRVNRVCAFSVAIGSEFSGKIGAFEQCCGELTC